MRTLDSTLQGTDEVLSPAPLSRARAVPEALRVPLCVALSLGAHALMTVVMPSEAALQPAATQRDLAFVSFDEVEVEVETIELPPPAPVVTPPEPPPSEARAEAPLPLAPATPPDAVTDPAPSAPPPAAAEVLAATSAAAGGPVFTTGTAGGSAHGLGSTPTASETNPAATRASEGTSTVDLSGLARGYLSTLNGRVRPAVVYPRAAVIAGLEGTVMLGLLIDERGNILRRRVKRSSGHASLDAAVLDAAERVSSVPAPPNELRSQWSAGPRELTVPIRMTVH